MTRPLAFLGAALLASACSGSDGTAATYHVDPAAGADSKAGTSRAAAWKHAPGDARASGIAARTRLQPGDTVLFRAGLPYRGSIRLPASGTAERPITYSGLGWGEGLAILDGSDPVDAAVPCRSAADCGGAPDWKALHRISYTPAKTARVALFGQGGLYWLSQLPQLPDPFFSDDRTNFAIVSQRQAGNLRAGFLESREFAAAARAGGTPELAIWVNPNIVERRPVLRVEGDRLFFDPEGLNFYTDRDSRAALNGSFAGLARPGSFLTLAPGVLIARLREGDTAASLSVGSGRFGIEMGGQSHVRIAGFHFRNFSGSRGAVREGLAITSFAPSAHAIEVRGNRFGPALLEHGNGIVQIFGTTGFRLIANRIEDIAFGGGLRAAGAIPRDMLIEGNVLRRIGRTAIGLLSTEDVVVRGNILADVRGVHGNAITAYLANRNILIEGNCVIASDRPLTFHGNRTPDVRSDIVIRDNILVSAPGGRAAAISSWGMQTVGVTISGNILAGDGPGILLNGSDREVLVTGNDTTGITVNGDQGRDWQIRDNGQGLTLSRAVEGRFTEKDCAVPASRLELAVSRSPG